MALQDRQPRMVYISPDAINRDEKGTKLYHMTCQSGGEVEVYIEPVLPKPQLRIFGKSHIAMALAKVAKAVEYQVDVVMTTADANVFPEADSLIELNDFKGTKEHASQYMIVCTQGERDAEALFAAINANPQYLAFVASRRKANAIFSELRGMGITFDQLKTIKTPAGLDIGSETPQEITVCSVCLLDAPVVCNVLPLRGDAVEVEVDLLGVKRRVLVDDALGALHELLASLGLPPVLEVA